MEPACGLCCLLSGEGGRRSNMTKRLTIGFIVALLALSAQAEVIVQEDFEGQRTDTTDFSEN